MNIHPAVLPLVLIFFILSVVFGLLAFAVRNWPLPKILTGRMASVMASGLAGLLVLVWHMGATGDWTPDAAAVTTLSAFMIPLFAILFAGGEDAPVAAARPRAEHERGVFPVQPAAEAPPRTATPGWPLVLGAVLLVAVAAGCTYAALQAAGWLRP
jgi:hypothetical protein